MEFWRDPLPSPGPSLGRLRVRARPGFLRNECPERVRVRVRVWVRTILCARVWVRVKLRDFCAIMSPVTGQGLGV